MKKNYWILKLSNYLIVLFGIILLSWTPEKRLRYPEGEFSFPLNPGQRNYLSGTMAELRPNHFHAGIDVKTYGATGLPLHSIGDGYVSRIKISPYGYGKALYIQHDNGYTSVYAHCERFAPEIDEYMRNLQYTQQRFAVEAFPEKNQFRVKKGSIIAYSGNTGSSQAPHLHFEIRDPAQRVLNPLFFSFEEIIDNIPPTMDELAIVPIDINSRIDGNFARKEFTTYSRNARSYYLADKIKVKGPVGIQLKTYDRGNGAPNKNGVSAILLEVDGELTYSYFAERFSFGESRQINRHMDFGTKVETGQYFNNCFIEDGNQLDFYETKNKGIIDLEPGETKSVKLTSWDSFKNKSTLTFELSNDPATPVKEQVPEKKYEIIKNTLKVYSNRNDTVTAVYLGYQKELINRSYVTDKESVFLWDLRKGLPDSIVFHSKTMKKPVVAMFPVGENAKYFGKKIDFEVFKGSLFDTLYLDIIDNANTFAVGDFRTPLERNVAITITSDETPDEKTKVYSKDGEDLYFEGGTWDGQDITFTTRYLGVYTILKDSIPPDIRLRYKRQSGISFILSDDLSGVAGFDAFINNEWVLMNYDQANSIIWSETKNHEPLPSGDFRLEVYDEVGNKTVYTTKI